MALNPAFVEAARKNEKYAEAWAFLGESVQHMPSSADDPLELLQRAQKLDPESLSVLTFTALYWNRHGEHEKALKALQRATEIYPKNPAVQAEVGRTSALLGDLDLAQEAYQKATELAPNDPGYLRLLALFSIQHDLYVRQIALPAARRAVILEPSDPANLDLMAQTLVALNDLVSARRFLQRALQQDPNYPPAHLHLGFIALLQGNQQQAFDRLLLARSLDPEGPTGQQVSSLLQTYFP